MSHGQQMGFHRWQGFSQAARHWQTRWSVVMHAPSWDTCPWRRNPALCLCRRTDLCLIQTSPKNTTRAVKNQVLPIPLMTPTWQKGQNILFQL